MSVSVMIAGALFRTAVQKTSKAGKVYTTATLKSVAGTEVNTGPRWSLVRPSKPRCLA